MIGERNIIPGKSRKRNENFPYRQKESAGGKLKFYNIKALKLLLDCIIGSCKQER